MVVREVASFNGKTHLIVRKRNVGTWLAASKSYLAYRTPSDFDRELRAWTFDAEIVQYLRLHGCKTIIVDVGSYSVHASFNDLLLHSIELTRPTGDVDVCLGEKWWHKKVNA